MTTSVDRCSRFESYLIAGLDDTKLAKPKSADRRFRLESYLMAALDDLAKPGDIALDIETYYSTPAVRKDGPRIPSAVQ